MDVDVVVFRTGKGEYVQIGFGYEFINVGTVLVEVQEFNVIF